MTTPTPCLRAVQSLRNLLPSSAKAREKRKLARKPHWLESLAVVLCMVNAAAANEFGVLTYLQSNGEITITRCSPGARDAVAIPAAIYGVPVKRIASQAFYECIRVTSVTVPDSVTSIGDGAFAYCYAMTSVTLPNSITSIGYATFASCQSLTSMTIPDSVTSIGQEAFRNCYGLANIAVPAGVTSIGYAAFNGCQGLTAIMVDAENSNYTSENGILFDKLKTTLIQCPISKVGVGYYAIPVGVVSIANSAFASCKSLTGITIPSGVTNIPNWAFMSCGNLTTVSIPGSVTHISGNAFQYCYSLASLTLPTGLTGIGSEAFAECAGLTGVTIPSAVTWINGKAFYGCSGLTSACFMGDAPIVTEPNVFESTASGFTVYYLNGATGFSTPTWRGYPAFPGVACQFTSAAAPVTGNVGTAYNHTCTAAGTPAPAFAVTSGALPDGLTLGATGAISGNPTATGIFTGTITASNGIPPEATQDFVIDTNEYRTLAASGTHGSLTGSGIYLLTTPATLTATPAPGYLFTGWTGDATGTANPLFVLMDADKSIGATFAPDSNDDDGDGLTNFQEIVDYGTDPTKPDTDGDGVNDKKDAFPLDPAETLDTDRDGIGDNADTDDDGDGLTDVDEMNTYGTNPKRADSDGDGLTDPAELETHHTNPNIADTDNDGLRDGEEFTAYHTNPLIGDTDGDGFLDGYEVLTGKLPLDPLDKPALVAEARTAIEFTFPAAVGKSYRIEASTDLAAWEIVESGIAGTGGQIQRFYSTRDQPKRYFRVEEGG